MKLTPGLSLLFALVMLPGMQSSQDAPGSPADELMEADLAFSRETGERGLEGWLAWFADDAVILKDDGQAARGAAEVRDHYASQSGFPPPGFHWEPKSAGLASSGELGWTAGTYSTAQVKDAGRYLSVWKLQADGEWKVQTDLGGDPEFRTRLARLAGPPDETSSQAPDSWISADGELAVSTGTWKAKRDEQTTAGRFLSVWERDDKGVWSILTEIGGADS